MCIQNEQINNQRTTNFLSRGFTASAGSLQVEPNSNRRALLISTNADLSINGGSMTNWLTVHVFKGRSTAAANILGWKNPYTSLNFTIEEFGVSICGPLFISFQTMITDYDWTVQELVLNDPTGEMLSPLTQRASESTNPKIVGVK